MNRAEDAGQEIVRILLVVAVHIAKSTPYNAPTIAAAVQWAYEEAGDAADEETLEATAMAKLSGHDPETRS